MSVEATGVPWRRAGGSPTTVVAWLTRRRAVRSGAAWGAVFGGYVATSALGYASAYPTAASRAQLAASLGSNTGLAALLGPARQIDTVAGFTAWRCLGVLSMVGGIWGVLTATRLLRGEEEAGRWELLLAGQTTRQRAALQALTGLVAGWAALLGATAVITVVAGRRADPPFALGDALFLSLALVSSALMFLAVGALASQLAATRRQAAAFAGGAFGVCVVIRMVADSGSTLQWMRWISPLGWVQELRPMTGAQPLLLLPIVVFVVVTGGVALMLAAQRDLGSSTLPSRDTAPARTRLLTGPTGLAMRLTRPVALGWIAAAGGLGLLLGLVAKSAADAAAGSSRAQEILGRFGAPRFDAQAYLGVAFLVVTTVVALVASGQVVAAREEEAESRLDNLLVRPVGRTTWLIGRLGVAAAVVVAVGVAAGVLTWVGSVAENAGVAFPTLVEAGINTAPPGLFLLGAGALGLAAVPRLTGVVAYGLVAWSFLLQLIGSIVNAPRWLLELSLFRHVAPAPATDPDWTSAAVLVALGVLAAGAAAAMFSRRDLVTA